MSNFGYEHSKPNLYAGHQNDNYYWTHADARTEYNLTRTEIDLINRSLEDLTNEIEDVKRSHVDLSLKIQSNDVDIKSVHDTLKSVHKGPVGYQQTSLQNAANSALNDSVPQSRGWCCGNSPAQPAQTVSSISGKQGTQYPVAEHVSGSSVSANNNNNSQHLLPSNIPYHVHPKPGTNILRDEVTKVYYIQGASPKARAPHSPV